MPRDSEESRIELPRIFVGWEKELEALQRLVGQGREIRRQTIVVSGDYGVGKTALVRRFMERRPPGPLQARLKMIVGGESLIYEDPPASSENSLNCEGWVNKSTSQPTF